MSWTAEHSGIFAVHELSVSDHPLSIAVTPTGHHEEGGKPCFAYTVAGFIDSDAHGGTRAPVTIAGTDIAGWGDARDMAASLANFLDHYREARASAIRNGGDGSTDRYGDPLPQFTSEQWELIEQEGERLSLWALETREAAAG